MGAAHVAEARIAAAVGLEERAVRALERAFAAGKEYDLWLHRDPDFQPLRTNPSFQRLLVPRR
jgi:hypothetical protein